MKLIGVLELGIKPGSINLLAFFIIPDTYMSKSLLVFAFILYSHLAGQELSDTVRLFLTSSCISSSNFSLKKCELLGCGEWRFTAGARKLHGSYRYWHAKYFLLKCLWIEPITQSSIVLVPPPNPSTFQWYWVVWTYKEEFWTGLNVKEKSTILAFIMDWVHYSNGHSDCWPVMLWLVSATQLTIWISRV